MSMIERYGPLIETIAQQLGCEARALRAILRVESPGEGLFDGRPVLRLEINHFWETVGKEKQAAVDAHFHVGGPRAWEGHQWRPTPDVAWIPMHQPGLEGQRAEWMAMDLAIGIEDRAAIESASWGAGQILGCYWQQLGYSSWDSFATAQRSESEQILTFARYLDRVAHLQGPLARRDWTAIAISYNGTGKSGAYARSLEAAYARG